MPVALESTPSLAQRVRGSCPWAFVVPHRLLRRVVRIVAENDGRSTGTFRLDSFSLPARELWQAVDPLELDLDARPDDEGSITLIRETETKWFRRPPAIDEYVRVERALFRERVVVSLGRGGDREAFERADQIGRAAYADCLSVLDDEGRLRSIGDPWTCYADLAATLLELRRFAPRLIPVWFPVLDDVESVFATIGVDVDPDRIATEAGLGSRLDVPPPSHLAAGASRKRPSERTSERAARRARRLAESGNWTRGVLVEDRAVGAGDGSSRDVAQRFADLLERTVDGETDWWDVVVTLARSDTDGRFWSPTARLLYDLERAALDADRTAYSVRLVEWITSFGRKSLRRPVPLWSHTRVLRHLRRASRRLLECGLPDEDYERLGTRIEEAIHRRGERLRDVCRPQVEAALETAGLDPIDPVHRAARTRVVEEYLDVVVARGFASLSVLRDVLARNDLKLPDLTGVGQALTADPLLRIDRELEERLLGLHRRGEFYLRWLQTLGGLAFGTTFGRRVLTHVVIPFGGALLVLEGLQHLAVEPLALLFHDMHHVHLAHPVSIVAVGLAAHVLIHAPRLRQRILRNLSRWLSGFVRLPWTIGGWLRRIPILVRRVLWWLVRPVLVLLVAGGVLQAMEIEPILPWTSLAVVYLGTLLVVNSRPVRLFEEVLTQELSQSWQGLWQAVVQFGRLVLEFFRAVVDGIERVLYATDESLRSREGEGRVASTLRLVVGPLWSAVAYVVRFVVNLLIEPQINPLKHFPVVTVSHKLLLPTIPAFARVLETAGYDTAAAYTTAGGIVAVIPGAFGFLVWELMGNWRLYEANRPRTVVPARIGGHGETMAGLLRRGLHSGTLPRARARLRRAVARGDKRAIEWARHHVHEVAEQVERFVERQFVTLLETGSDITPIPVAPSATDGHGDHGEHAEHGSSLVRIRLGVRWLEITVAVPTPVTLTIAERQGRLLASVEGTNLESLPPESAAALRNAILGLYGSFGIDLVREQLSSVFPEDEYDVEPRAGGIVVRSRPEFDEVCVIPSTAGSPLVPRRLRGSVKWPPQLGQDLLLSAQEVGWNDWVAHWAEPASSDLLPGYRLLPTTATVVTPEHDASPVPQPGPGSS